MEKEVIIAIFIIILLVLFIIKAHGMFIDDRVYVRAFDGRKYRVRNTNKKIETANALAKLNKKVHHLLDRLVVASESETSYKPAIFRLKTRYNPDTLSEGRIDKRYTSYTVNKGEQMVLCLRTRDNKDEIYDDNIIFYVTLHELAHVASVGEDHNDEFHHNFRYLLRKASEWDMFKKINDKFHYCGMDVNGM